MKKATDSNRTWTTTTGRRYDHQDVFKWLMKLTLCRHKAVAESPFRPDKVWRKRSRVKGHWSPEHEILRNGIKLLRNGMQNFSLWSAAFQLRYSRKNEGCSIPRLQVRGLTTVRGFNTGQNDFASHSSIKGLVRSEQKFNTVGSLDSPLGLG